MEGAERVPDWSLDTEDSGTEELEQVYKELYSGDPDLQQHAIGRIAVWKCRSGSSLPIAVESTMTLFQARLECQSANAMTTRQLYSMVLIRFINHITEKGQTKQYAMSVHQLASQIGLPDWIVDLRHEATHATLPSLCVLTAAVDWALEWLKTHYWEKQIQVESMGPGSGDGRTDTLKELLVEYQRSQFAARQNGKGNGRNTQLMKRLQPVLMELGASACSCLLDDGCMVCTVEQLTSLGISTTAFMNGPLLFPKALLQFWQPLLDLLGNCDLVVPFLMHTVSMVTGGLSLRNKTLYGWMYTIVNVSNQRKPKPKDFTMRSQTRIPFKQLLRKCLQADSIYSKELISLLLRQLEPAVFNANDKEHLQNILDIYHGDPMEKTETDTVLHTVTDIEQSTSTKNKWEVYMESYDWTTCPIGRLPNQELGYKTMEIDSKEDIDMEQPVRMEEGISQREDLGGPLPQMITEDGWTEDQLKSISQQICLL